MVEGTMYIGLPGAETIKIPNTTHQDFQDTLGRLTDGRKMEYLAGSTWVNPAQVTYVRFAKN